METNGEWSKSMIKEDLKKRIYTVQQTMNMRESTGIYLLRELP